MLEFCRNALVQVQFTSTVVGSHSARRLHMVVEPSVGT